MRNLKSFIVLLVALGLVVCAAGSTLLLAGQTDPPHQTHLDLLRGPGMGGDGSPCLNCHTSGTPGQGDVDFDTCSSCHSPGGAYDGYNDLYVGALNNWENIGDPADATQSLIYEDSKLKSGKEKWCASCHDEDASEETILIDNFEGYVNDAGLQANWKRVNDAKLPRLEPQSTGEIAPEGDQCMRVRIKWAKTTEDEGIVKNLYDPFLDLTGMDAINFYIKLNNTDRFTTIRVRVKKYPENTWCKVDLPASDLESGVWKYVSFPRSSFSDTTWGKINSIQFRFFEASPSSNYAQNVYIDKVYFTKSVSASGGPNVVGDNVTHGYYVTGHRMSCDHCHDSTSDHIDGQSFPILEYIKNITNPTNFRFYDDPTKQLRLPYNYDNTFVYNNEDFALCYWCHSETDLIGDPWGDGTNFKDGPPPECGLSPNLHYLHVYNFADDQWPQSCAHCHDPHGQLNPVMTRKEMGDAFVFDTNGCEITDREDQHDPEVNMGLALRTGDLSALADGPTCDSCHYEGEVTPPNQPPCNPGDNPYTSEGCLNDGFYVRTYERVGHAGGCVDESCAAPGCHDVTQGSHGTHTQGTAKGPDPLACADCHVDCSPYMEDILSGGACDACHSPLGAFDGVQMGAANWDSGVYESDGTTLKSGKENWCLSCHDDNPNTPENESAVISGIYAPNIAGDQNNGDTYGFNLTGHNINCLNCHDAGQDHIDAVARTYEVTEGSPPVAVNPYSDSYRLRAVDGQPAMNLPRVTASSNPMNDWPDFALCLDCHDRNEVLAADVSGTNFWHNDAVPVNSHRIHLGLQSRHFDSDWDGAADSTQSCIACHNVHGAPNAALVRHGELISTPGTTDKVPALNFSYLVGGPVPATGTATWMPNIGTAGDYTVYAWWTANVNRATNAAYTIYYDGGSQTINVNQRVNGSQWNELGTFSFVAGTSGYIELSNEAADGQVIADAIRWVKDPEGTPEIILDDGDPEFSKVGPWSCVSKSGAYNNDLCFIDQPPAGNADPNATLAESIGGIMDLAGPTIPFNGVCNACHGAVIYEREPNLSPKVINAQAAPDSVVNDGTGTTLITAIVYDPDGDFAGNIVVDLTAIGGSASQQMFDDGTNGDVTAADGVYSFEATVDSGTADSPQVLAITATDGASNQGTALLTVYVIVSGGIYLDESDASFDCEWTYASKEDAYDGDLRFIDAGSGLCKATWTPDIPAAGNYTVHAWWTTNPNRATDAPYTIYYDGGSQTIDVNQQINGSQWNQLGTGSFPFTAGSAGYVVLSDDANGQVIADAVKFVPQP